MSLIYIKHPSKHIQENQENMLATLQGEDKIQQALMLNFGNASYRYHNVEPTIDDYEQWLEGLPENVRESFQAMSYEKSRAAFPLKRFANELRDVGLEKYIKGLLKPEDYESIKKIGQ